MVKALFDTVILIDYLNGVAAAREEISRYDDRAISAVSWMETLAGAAGDLEAPTRAFLAGFRIVPIDENAAERAVILRRERRLKLPDAIIWASAQIEDRLFVTRDLKAFPEDDPGVRIPYRL